MGQVHSLAEARQKRARIVEQEQFEAAILRVPEEDKQIMHALVEEYGFKATARVIESHYGKASDSLH